MQSLIPIWQEKDITQKVCGDLPSACCHVDNLYLVQGIFWWQRCSPCNKAPKPHPHNLVSLQKDKCKIKSLYRGLHLCWVNSIKDQWTQSWTPSWLGWSHQTSMNPTIDFYLVMNYEPPLTVGLIHHGWVDPIKDWWTLSWTQHHHGLHPDWFDPSWLGWCYKSPWTPLWNYSIMVGLTP